MLGFNLCYTHSRNVLKVRGCLKKIYYLFWGVALLLPIRNYVYSDTLIWDQSLWSQSSWSKPLVVSVSTSGSGSGTIFVNSADCAESCQFIFDSGQLLNISASVSQNTFFAGFSPNICNSASSCQFRLMQPLALNAEFVALSDTTPDSVEIIGNEGARVRTISTFAPIPINGTDGPVVASISYGEFSVNCTGHYTNLPSLVMPGSTICVRHSVKVGETSSVLTVGNTEFVFITSAAKLAKRKRLVLKLIPMLQQ